MLRIVAVADTHTFEADLAPIPEGDVFVHAGDFCRAGSLEELRPVAAWMQALPHRHKIVIAGNHERCFEDDAAAARKILGPNITYLQDSACVIEGLKFWGSPWQPAFHSWAFNLQRGKALAEKWAMIPADTDVLITHGPPMGYGDRCWDERTGCSDLFFAIERVKPALHLFGHIHQDGGLWQAGRTSICNATTWECERAPSVLDIDPQTRRVEAVHIPPPK